MADNCVRSITSFCHSRGNESQHGNDVITEALIIIKVLEIIPGGGIVRWPPAVPAPAKTSALPEETGDLIAPGSTFPRKNPWLLLDLG